MQQVQRTAQRISQYVKNQDSLKHLSAFVSFPSSSLLSSQVERASHNTGPLNGLFIAVKDNICTSDLPTTCASRGLKDFTSPYDATSVSRVMDAGAILAGKTNLDEFGMGSHSIHSVFGPVRTRDGHSAGGSSGGSAVAVATHQCDIALGTDTGGSVRLPAAFNGVYGFKPSYGLISRWGLIAYANSLDTVGILARDVAALRRVFDVCNAYDDKDPTSLSVDTRSKLASMVKLQAGRSLRIGVPLEYNISSMSQAVRAAWIKTLSDLQGAGHSIHPVSLPSTERALSAYYVLAPAEASSNLAKYDSVRYGSRPSATDTLERDADTQARKGGLLFSRARQHGFGEEVRRRILLGAYSLSADAFDNYFVQAQKVRRQVQDEFSAVFTSQNILRKSSGRDATDAAAGVDVLVCPTAPTVAPKLEAAETQDPLEAYADDILTVPASLAGLPAISIPAVEPDSKAKVGMQIIAQYGHDSEVLDLAAQIEAMTA